jgi:hypothetical protein
VGSFDLVTFVGQESPCQMVRSSLGMPHVFATPDNN